MKAFFFLIPGAPNFIFMMWPNSCGHHAVSLGSCRSGGMEEIFLLTKRGGPHHSPWPIPCEASSCFPIYRAHLWRRALNLQAHCLFSPLVYLPFLFSAGLALFAAIWLVWGRMFSELEWQLPFPFPNKYFKLFKMCFPPEHEIMITKEVAIFGGIWLISVWKMSRATNQFK